MSWTKVLDRDELSVDTRQVVKVGKQKILLINHSGKLYAVDNACPHLKLSIKKGKITEDGAIVCPFHRSAFDLETGEVKNWTPWPPVMGKALGMMSKPKTLPTFPIEIREGSIWIDIEQE